MKNDIYQLPGDDGIEVQEQNIAESSLVQEEEVKKQENDENYI